MRYLLVLTFFPFGFGLLVPGGVFGGRILSPLIIVTIAYSSLRPRRRVLPPQQDHTQQQGKPPTDRHSPAVAYPEPQQSNADKRCQGQQGKGEDDGGK